LAEIASPLSGARNDNREKRLRIVLTKR
jgi:hypothetical protein